MVFPNIDHVGSAFDGYQYSIAGSNDGVTWTLLFDALTVTGAGEPFTLGNFFGTAPSTVNNVLTGGGGVGYEAQFTFGTAYKFYAFGASTEAFNAGNTDSELSAVGTSQDQCSGALPVLNATGCGALITLTTDTLGNLVATVTTPGNGNPYDGAEDTLVGIQNNSGATLNSIDLSSSTTPVFGFDGDGPCPIFNANDCFHGNPPGAGFTGYEGPNNTFSNISTDFKTGTVNFTTPIGPNGSGWFALEGQPSSVSSVSASSFTTPPQPIVQGQTNTFVDGTKINQSVLIPSGATLNGAASMAVKFTEVAQATFDSTRLPATSTNTWSGGTALPVGTTCFPISSANNKCVVIEELCFSDAAGTIAIPCNIIAGTALIDLTSVYGPTLNSGNGAASLPPNPSYPTASDGGRDWADIFTTANTDCCSISGGTKGVNTDYFIGDKPPVITITTPANSATYVLNQAVAANFTCADPQVQPTGFPTCTGANPGTILSGSNIDTASLGSKTLTVSSTDAVGTMGMKSVNYNVVLGPLAKVSPPIVNFGNVEIGDFPIRVVTLTNIGQTPMTITNVKVVPVSGRDSDDFFDLSLCPKTLGVGKSCIVFVAVFGDADNANPQATLTITDNVPAPGGPQFVPLTATVVPEE